MQVINEMDALIVVDVQNDFCPGGALAIPNGDEVVPVLNGYMPLFPNVFVSKDWHPQQTSHFDKWPAHCVQGTMGAELHPKLKLPANAVVVTKGMYSDRDDYSAAQAEMENGTNVVAEFKKRGIARVFVGGLATEFCDKDTALGFKAEGFEVVFLLDACRGLSEAGVAATIEELKAAGIIVVASLDAFFKKGE